MNPKTAWKWEKIESVSLDGRKSYTIQIETDGPFQDKIALLGKNKEENAERIVRAVNAHEELLSMLKTILADSKSETDDGGKTTVDEEAVAALIAKAEAQS